MGTVRNTTVIPAVEATRGFVLFQPNMMVAYCQEWRKMYFWGTSWLHSFYFGSKYLQAMHSRAKRNAKQKLFRNVERYQQQKSGGSRQSPCLTSGFPDHNYMWWWLKFTLAEICQSVIIKYPTHWYYHTKWLYYFLRWTIYLNRALHQSNKICSERTVSTKSIGT